MKYIIKKFWIVIVLALIINIPILILGTAKTNQTVTLKGDTTIINRIVDIDTPYAENGSFSSIYIISFDHSTWLQNFFVKYSKTSELEPMNENYKHFTAMENYEMGQIQKNSSIMTSLITAYTAAKKEDSKIHIDYSFKSLCVSFYFLGSPFKIGDEIIKYNNISSKDVDVSEFSKMVRESKKNDVLTILRNKETITITLSDNAYRLCRWYDYYDIDYSTIFPKVTINKTTVGGPSGGLLQTLSIYNRLIEEDLTKGLKIAGTGTMNVYGNVGAIGGIKQKVYTAFEDSMDVFLCPKIHEEEALEAYNQIKHKEKMAFVCVETLDDAIRYLRNVKKV